MRYYKARLKKPNTKDGYLGQAIDMAIKALEEREKLDKAIEEIKENVLKDVWKVIKNE